MHFEKDGQVFFRVSTAQGLCGTTLGVLAHGSDVSGATLRCALLTKAMAKLALSAGIAAFDADCATREAIAYLEGEEADLAYREIAEAADASEALEASLCGDPGRPLAGGELLDFVKARTLTMIDHHVVPRDELLSQPFPYRLGRGGGGT